MNFHRVGIPCLAFLSLTGFAGPNASGIYVVVSPREVDLVQLVQTGDGKVAGRLETTVIGPDGSLKDTSVAMDGVASQRDLMFKRTSVWTAGVDGTGTFSDDVLTVVLGGTTLRFPRSDLPAYQTAIAHLRSEATIVRRQYAAMQSAKSARDAQARAARAASDRGARIEALVTQLRADAGTIDVDVANCPDFGHRAEANSDRIDRMTRIAPSLTDPDRNQLIVQANRVFVDTSQIEVARSQYAIQLNRAANDGGPIADRLAAFCASTDATSFTRQCDQARDAVSKFRSAIALGQKTFAPYKEALRQELERQAAAIRRMGA